jgi:LmbE family N-acetylglucosaminyl deacetylase
MPLPDGKPARLMVITAHPVDAFDNSGGTCAEHIRQGDQVTALICTSGINTHNERLLDELRKPDAERDPEILRESPEDYAARKQTEAEQALGCFGIADVVILPYDDHRASLVPEMIDDIERIICDRKPHIVIMQDPKDGLALFDDHALIGIATWKGIQKAGGVRYGDPRAPWRPLEIYCLGTFGVTTGPFSNHYERISVAVDVTRHVEAKVRAHQFIATQGQNVGWGQKRIEGIEGHVGIFSGVSYAEAFVRLKTPVCETLPISPKVFEDSKHSSAENFKRNHKLIGAFVPEADGAPAGGFPPKE